MIRVCLPHTQLPGTSSLFADYLYHFERVQSLYDHSPNDAESFKSAMSAVRIPDDRRLAVASALRKLNGNHPGLDLLELPETVAVVTGQQVGLFSGPAYTVYKALTAARLARELNSQGIRAVPIFWMATEDHDLAEVDHVNTFDVLHRPTTLRATGHAAPGQPIGSVGLKTVPLDQLADSLEGFLYRDEVLSMVEEAYQPGRTLGEAFYQLLRRMLAGYGLIFVDPMDPEIRKVAAPFLREAILQAPELSEKILARNKELIALGYHAQVHFEAQSSLFFRLQDNQRLALRRHNGEYVHEGQRFSTEELAADAANLSPNALLRPVMQDFLLPTVAYVGGPAELAYLAQSQVLYHQLIHRMPVALSRAGFTLLDDRSANLLNKFDLTVADTFHGEDALRERIALRLIPPALDQSFSHVLSVITESTDRLQLQLAGFDPTLGEAMARSRAKMIFQVEKNRRKTSREALRREQRIADGAAHLSGLLFPQRHLQERYYSMLPFLAKHGMDLLDQLFDNIQHTCPDHLLLSV